MSSKPRFTDIAGAPFKIGERVRVVAGIDETFEEGFLGRLGTIEYFEYDCGCGQTFPSDPMIGVRFSNCIEEFWTEELQVVERVN
jgi:hypothetical protein